jgi:hypothetical protein
LGVEISKTLPNISSTGLFACGSAPLSHSVGRLIISTGKVVGEIFEEIKSNSKFSVISVHFNEYADAALRKFSTK